MMSSRGDKAPPNRLGELRRDSGLTRRQLAQAIGVDPTTVKRWERRDAHVPGSLQGKVAGVLGVSVAFLMCREGRIPHRGVAPARLLA